MQIGQYSPLNNSMFTLLITILLPSLKPLLYFQVILQFSYFLENMSCGHGQKKI